jgi:hypothetical protein
VETLAAGATHHSRLCRLRPGNWRVPASSTSRSDSGTGWDPLIYAGHY